jgi:hypothetical protein
MPKIGIGIMGCGNIAKKYAISAIEQNKDLVLIAITNKNFTHAIENSKKFDCLAVKSNEELLNLKEIDAIYIALPPSLHYKYIKASLLHHKHVICEKPLVFSLDEAKELVQIAQDQQKVLFENFMFKYHSQHAFIKNKIAQIGEIRSFRSSFGFPPLDKTNFRYNSDLGGGSLLDAGTYTIKAAEMYLGNNLTIDSSSLVYDLENNVDIFGSISLHNQDGITGHLSFGFDNYYQCSYELWGSKGKIIAKRAFTPPPTFQPEMILEIDNKEFLYKMTEDDQFLNIFTDFSNSILKKNYSKQYDEIVNHAKLLADSRNSAEKF